MIYEDEATRLHFHKLSTELQLDLSEFEEHMASHGLSVQLVDLVPKPDGEDKGLEMIIRISDKN